MKNIQKEIFFLNILFNNASHEAFSHSYLHKFLRFERLFKPAKIGILAFLENNNLVKH